MKHKVTRLFIDFEKEEKWLNEMSAKGYHFISLAFPQYLFEQGKPGEYTYRLELLKSLPTDIEGKSYIEFMEEAGVECVDTFWKWAYFRKKTADGPFDLYTDLDSKIGHYHRVMTLLGVIVMTNLAIGLYNLGVAITFNKPLLPVLSFIVTALFGRLFFSFWKKVGRLKEEAKVRE